MDASLLNGFGYGRINNADEDGPMLNIEATEARLLSRQVATAPQPVIRPMPAIVWRSKVKPLPSGLRTPRRLHLVTAPSFNRREHQRRKRLAMRDRVVESAYIAAALGTAIVIWWSAR